MAGGGLAGSLRRPCQICGERLPYVTVEMDLHNYDRWVCANSVIVHEIQYHDEGYVIHEQVSSRSKVSFRRSLDGHSTVTRRVFGE